MSVIRALCGAVVFLVLPGLSASAQQLPWKGSLDQLDEFTEVINLSDGKIARQVLIGALSDPSIQLESVAIHAYTHQEACQNAFIGRRLANNYGGLKFKFKDKDVFEKAWFDQLNDACSSNEKTRAWTECAPDDESNEECKIAKVLADVFKNIGVEDQFIYTTAPLPYAASRVELRGLCASSHSGGGNSACARKLLLQ